jgi:hypothetical protein
VVGEVLGERVTALQRAVVAALVVGLFSFTAWLIAPDEVSSAIAGAGSWFTELIPGDMATR